MTTDITELVQREKFEAWLEGAEALPWGYLKKRRTSDDTYHEPNTTDMWAAWKAAGAELVEVLEASEKTSEARREAIDRTHNMFIRERDRANAAEEALEKAHERIAELESRTVIVKLPPTIWYEHDDYAQEIAVLEKSRVLQALTAAGIKWEVE